MPRKLVIPDIHGCKKTLKALLKRQVVLQPSDELYFLGDYIDRGPDSKGVIDYIFKLESKGFNIHLLKGNHEDLLLKSLHKKLYHQLWMQNGGDATLKSFAIKQVTEIEEKYLHFFYDLRYYLELENVFLVHAGFNFNIVNPFLDKDAMLWVREFKPRSEILKGKTIFHGHTPTPLKEIEKSIKRNDIHISLDAGCVYKNKKGMGFLCCFDLISRQLYFQENIEG